MRLSSCAMWVALSLAVVAGAQPSAYAADLAGLSWGDFTLNDVSTSSVRALSPTVSGQTMSAGIELEGFSATAEGEKTEASATFSGQFLLTQPKRVALQQMRVIMRGLIIKAERSTVRLEVKIGDVAKSIEWTETESKTGRYESVITETIPNGRLSSPLPVSAVATVYRPTGASGALVSIDTIRLEFATPMLSKLPDDYRPDNNKLAKDIPVPAYVAYR